MDLAHLVERKTMSIYDVDLYEKIYKINDQLIEELNGNENENEDISVDETLSSVFAAHSELFLCGLDCSF